MKAKDTSHIGMIIGAVCLIVMFAVTVYKVITTEYRISTDNALGLIFIGISPSLPFSPIYVSKWLDKLIDLRKGDKPRYD